jgi:hypothetical protein
MKRMCLIALITLLVSFSGFCQKKIASFSINGNYTKYVFFMKIYQMQLLTNQTVRSQAELNGLNSFILQQTFHHAVGSQKFLDQLWKELLLGCQKEDEEKLKELIAQNLNPFSDIMKKDIIEYKVSQNTLILSKNGKSFIKLEYPNIKFIVTESLFGKNSPSLFKNKLLNR